MSLRITHFYRFGEFAVDADQRVLMRSGKTVPLAPKVFDTLLVLVENSGRIVQKEELMSRLWPDTFVEDANLAFNVQQLRKSLSDNARNPIYIETVARRGYRFIAGVEEELSDGGPAETARDHSSSSPFAVASPYEEQRSMPRPAIDRTVAPDGPSTSIRRGRFAALHNKRFLAAAAVMVIIIGGGVAWRFSLGPSLRSRGDSTRKRRSELDSLKFEKLTGTGQSNRVAISPDGKYLAYTSGPEYSPGIWLRQLATGTNVEIVRAAEPARIYQLEFANSGEYLYFVRGDPGILYQVSLLGGAPTKIVDDLKACAVSSDDSQIAFVRTVTDSGGRRQNVLIVAASDGANQRSLLTIDHPGILSALLWSPDGASLICVLAHSDGSNQDEKLIEVRISDGTKKDLSSSSFFHISQLAWLPGKSAIVMSARKKHEEDSQLWRVSFPDMEITQLTEGLISYGDLSVAASADKSVAALVTHYSDIWIGSSREPRNLKKLAQGTDNFCWAPNGQILYSSKASGNVDLWAMRRDGEEQRQLTVNPAIDGTPAVSPDNRYVVFVSDRTGVFEIWRMNFDGSNQIQLSNGPGTRPAISRDGEWVFYNASDWCLWKVSIDGGESVRLTDYPAVYPSLSPDGKLIACLGRNESMHKQSMLIVPAEGGQPLKRIEFTGGSFAGFRIQWAPDGKAIIYMAERYGPTAIIRQPLDGTPAEELAEFDEDHVFDFGYSPDGKYLAVTRGGSQYDLVLISDLGRQ